jgi:hypothetical protein
MRTCVRVDQGLAVRVLPPNPRNAKLSIVLPAAAELPFINLSDSLEILTLMAQEGDPRFERAAARWIGRLLVETPPMTLKEARWVVAMVEQLPRCRES